MATEGFAPPPHLFKKLNALSYILIINRLWRKEIPLHGLGLNIAFFGCEIKENHFTDIQTQF